MGSCFVIMGFGEKTDFQSNPQRVLNLNRTYEDIIKPVVEEAGHICVRADEIIHSTVIDKPMYDNLLSADLVIADLSTANVNAVYELGVRHALRPQRTIVLAENNFSFPFDLNHLSILKYEHLGKEIGFKEVMRVRQELTKKITALMDSPEPDSPVFLFIPSLQPASLPKAPAIAAAAPPAPSSAPMDQEQKSFAELLASFRAARDQVKAAEDWALPLALLKRLKAMQPDDPYILQQLALATYKFQQPDKKASLINAKNILSALVPQTSSDAETVGLWGAIHKRLWDATEDREHLDEAVRAYSRGYYIRTDYYNGINYAFVLDVRASRSEGDEALVDRLLARRVRKDVLKICDRLLQATSVAAEPGLKHFGPGPGGDEPFWIGATKVEALFGLGRRDEADLLKVQIFAKERERLGTASWNEASLNDQLKKLGELLPP
ncbi:TRAFs-binding domain-containing protein [Bradyrhizobium sp. AZCC 1693]|uniref:TRAFs-binding domain-containing protein n=1 Tax=Bradyrhizobium sp. AZCC 1693 TaxID=3117029 RepID=UPI002FF34949